MVLGAGHEYERTTSLHLASRSRGGQFCIAPLLGVHGLRARQGRGAEPGLFARPCEICSSDFRRALPALMHLQDRQTRASLNVLSGSHYSFGSRKEIHHGTFRTSKHFDSREYQRHG